MTKVTKITNIFITWYIIIHNLTFKELIKSIFWPTKLAPLIKSQYRSTKLVPLLTSQYRPTKLAPLIKSQYRRTKLAPLDILDIFYCLQYKKYFWCKTATSSWHLTESHEISLLRKTIYFANYGHSWFFYAFFLVKFMLICIII